MRKGEGASALGDTKLSNTMSAGDGNGPIAAVAQRLCQINLIRQVSAPQADTSRAGATVGRGLLRKGFVTEVLYIVIRGPPR